MGTGRAGRKCSVCSMSARAPMRAVRVATASSTRLQQGLGIGLGAQVHDQLAGYQFILKRMGRLGLAVGADQVEHGDVVALFVRRQRRS